MESKRITHKDTHGIGEGPNTLCLDGNAQFVAGTCPGGYCDRAGAGIRLQWRRDFTGYSDRCERCDRV